MRLSLIAARSENGVIGSGPDIPWNARGEQLLFKALTYNQWLLVGRKTFESMGMLPNRKYAVISRKDKQHEGVLVFPSIKTAIHGLNSKTNHVFVSGGGQIYEALISQVNTIHISTVHEKVDGDIYFPEIPQHFSLVFEQKFQSNIDYTYQIWSNLNEKQPAYKRP